MSQKSLDLTNTLVVSLFRHSLFAVSLLWFSGLAVVLMVAIVVTKLIMRFNMSSEGIAEPRARTYLRWGFGALWLIDGILQFQASMPLGLANQVVAPATVGTPGFLHSLMEHGIFIWNSHPITMAVGVAWLQVGIGLILLVSNGRTGRWVGGIAGVWAAIIWLIGNGAGGIFVHGATILFGWPGATLFYAIAGFWLFVKPATFREQFSRVTLRTLSVVLAVAVIFQCLPSAGFWRGGNANALTQMTTFMTNTAQPHWLAWSLRHIGDLSAQMGGGFNIVVILWLLVCAFGLWRSVRTGWQWPVRVLAVGCVFFWFTSEDTALFGGLSTDVNSLLPLALLAWCASPRLRTLEARERRIAREITSSAGAVVATFGSVMIVFASVTMAWTSFAGAEATLYLAQNGPASATSGPAPTFSLVDQSNKPYSLGEHRGHYTLLTFLDPHCWTDCPLLASQLAQVRAKLPASSNLDIVAVAADPYHEKISDLRRFMNIHGLDHVKNFYFVTGKLATVKKVWAQYGVGVTMKPTDKMSIHTDLMFIISPKGQLRWVIPDDPIGSNSGQASAVSELMGLLASSGVR
jgi:cytochrome oxidase Cu insertion factor (SCO1/SenC/PrrC family)